MHFRYCPQCGTKTVNKEIGDEGQIPFCEGCGIPLWDSFTTCIIAAVVNEFGEIALLRQDYVSRTNHVCVAGIMKTGESAEEAAVREISEELGLEPVSLRYVRSFPCPEKELLMLGFRADVKKAEFTLSQEVDSAEWFMPDKALDMLREDSIAWKLVRSILGEAYPSQQS